MVNAAVPKEACLLALRRGSFPGQVTRCGACARTAGEELKGHRRLRFREKGKPPLLVLDVSVCPGKPLETIDAPMHRGCVRVYAFSPSLLSTHC